MTNTFQLATLAQGTAGLRDVTELLEGGATPMPHTYQAYSDIVGTDLTGAPIMAGLPKATWHWDWLSRADYALLKTYSGGCYVCSNLGDDTFGVFQAVLAIPKEPAPITGRLCGPVDLEFVQMVRQ